MILWRGRTLRWESVTLNNMTALIQLCSGKMKVGYMHICISANKHISAASAGIFATLISLIPLLVFFLALPVFHLLDKKGEGTACHMFHVELCSVSLLYCIY